IVYHAVEPALGAKGRRGGGPRRRRPEALPPHRHLAGSVSREWDLAGDDGDHPVAREDTAILLRERGQVRGPDLQAGCHRSVTPAVEAVARRARALVDPLAFAHQLLAGRDDLLLQAIALGRAAGDRERPEPANEGGAQHAAGR